MAVSQFMENLIRETLDDDRRPDERRSRDTVNYTVETDDRRPFGGGGIATVSFRLSKPVPEEELGPRERNILQAVADGLDTSSLGIVDSILARYGLAESVGRRRTRGRVNVHLGQSDEEDLGTGAINTRRGRFISNTNLQSLLEIIAKNYLIQDMRRPNAPLKYRTGRFANSLNITSVGLDAADTGRQPRVSIFYTYMTNPYAVFDPMRSTRPALYNRPSPGARNPQVHIGDAIAKAARDVIHSRYRLDVREARR